MNLLEIIRENRLIYLTKEKLLDKLSLLTKEASIDLQREIDLLISDGTLYLDEMGRVSISADKGYVKAKLVLNKKGYGFAVVENQADIFIPAFAINGAFDGDDCLVEITNKKTDNDMEGRVVKIVRRNTTHVVGTYIVGKSKNVVFPDDERLPQIRINKLDAKDARNNEKVWVEIDMDTIGVNVMHGKIIEVLGQATSPKAEQLSIIRSYNLVENFDEQTLSEARKINQNVDKKKFSSRRDFTSQRVITIDGEDARDFDDAISVEKQKNGGYLLCVHIADVSHYVTENSHLDKEAFKRGTSVYFSNQVIPMLPKELSNGVCSLQEGKNRLTLSVEIKLDKDCNVLSSQIFEGIIKSNHRMTYTEIKNILAGDELLIEKYQDVYEDILTYQEISKKLADIRLKRGEIRFNMPEPFILENANGEIVSIENRFQDEAHEIIESLMILTNECVAKKFNDLGIPFVYRIHEKPDEMKVNNLSQLLKNLGVANQLQIDGDKPASYQKIIEKIEGNPKEHTITKLILRCMMKAKYSPANLGHFGIASENYCHFTSPIRRYPDLMIHRIIKKYLKGESVDDLKIKYKAVVERASVQSSATEKNADEAERAVDDYKKALFMQKYIGENFTGIISGVQEYGVFVELENGVEGLVRLDDLPMDEYIYNETTLSLAGKKFHYTIGDSLKVVVANVNLKLRQVDFDLEGVEPTLKNFVVKAKSASKGKSKSRKSRQKFEKSKSNKTSKSNYLSKKKNSAKQNKKRHK